MTALTPTGGSDVQEWATVLGSMVGGGALAEMTRAVFGRRGQRVDNVAKLEAIATGLAEKATKAADDRVAQIERAFADHKQETEEAAARRRVAAVAHAEWDQMVAAELRTLGASVPPPPPLEGVAL
ncbi:hypothetical protein [Nocardia rhizosphaerae]|uniref:Uncharacterized protein n=1 Tax=Nocardia rhizosphaerae TaxID=1691571 RepID=A0ABV8L2J8_9NOCA